MRISTWKKKLRYRLLLERKPKAFRYCGPSEARSITLVKRDNIGDFILSTTFLNPAYARWRDKHITFVCNPQVGRLARAFYPRWQVLSPSDSKYDYRINPFRRAGLKSRVLKWPASDLMLSLRSMRRPEEIAFDSWIPSGHKAAISNQYKKYEPGLLRLVPDEHEIYNEIIDAGHCSGGSEICRDILNYRVWLDYCFPESNECNARAFPAIPKEFLADGAVLEGIRE
jgi:hypothetical protein